MAISVEYPGSIFQEYPSVHEMAIEHGVRKFSLTTEGEQLAEEQPEALQNFFQATKALASRQIDTMVYPFIGKGKLSYVHELPETPQMCVKVSNTSTQGHKKHSHTLVTVPSLTAEAMLMHGIGKQLAKRDTGIQAPKVYAVAKAGTSQTMLQERIPENFICLETAIQSLDEETYKHILLYEKTLKKRILSAVGFSPLRLGMGDLTGVPVKRLSAGNVFINDPENPATTEMYIIDLMGPRLCRTMAARLFGSLH